MELKGDDLACERGGRQVFAGLSFRLASGGMLALRGPNGAGKTSLLRMIAGLVEPAHGSLVLSGGNPDCTLAQQCHLIAHQEAQKPVLTVEENLAFWGSFYGSGDVRRALDAFELTALADLPAALLSAGQRRRLALSRLALVERPIWLLDEPTTALDATSQMRLARLMGDHLAQGGLIVVATHVDLVVKANVVLDFEQLRRAA
ncbi:MAG: heme ABC exporter ATP-binding protein CcmA [Parvibaculaceae bacterium]